MNDQPAPVADRSQRSARFFNYLHRYKNLLRKRWWVLPITIAVGVTIEGFRVWKAPPSFVSMGQMIMSIKITTSTTGTGYSEEYQNFLGTQVGLMRSPGVQERAAERVRALKPNLAPVPVKVDVAVSPKTTIFNLQAVGREAEYTRAYLDAVMEVFLQKKAELRAQPSEKTLEGITKQVISLDSDLKRLEEEEIAFRATNNVVFIDEQVKSTAADLVQKQRRLDAFKSEYQLLTMLSLEQNLERQQKNDAVPSTGDDKDLTSTPANVLHTDYLREKQQLQLKKVELKEWSDILRPKHPRMIALNEEIARREKLLEIFKDQGKEQIESRRDAIALQITNLDQEIKAMDRASLDLTSKLSLYEGIRTKKLGIQKLRDDLQRALQSVGVEKDIDPGTVNILEPARPAIPAQMNLVKAFILAAALGLLGGLGLLVVADRLDDRPTSFTDLQDMFDEPVLGQIPLEFGKNGKPGVELLQAEDERHAFLEAYRNLRSSLLYMATQGKRPRVVLVTSAIPSDGKSMTTANLAITMALSGSRVLLVDADMRKGLLHKRFGLESGPGLNEVLTGQLSWNQAVNPTSTASLSLLPRGNTARNPGEMFLNPKTHEIIKELAAQYDYVIFDTAPVMAADDVTSLAPHIEGVIFVIRANYTSGRVARAALELLYQREVSVLGLVFNGVQTSGGEYYYYRYKDYYSDYKSA
jgi:capsular exopolysaccharide synthesis family protein